MVERKEIKPEHQGAGNDVYKQHQGAGNDVYKQLTRLISNKGMNLVPVIYIIYGPPPPHVLLNIEVTRRTNRIILLVSDEFPEYDSDVERLVQSSNSTTKTTVAGGEDGDEYYDSQPSVVFFIPMKQFRKYSKTFKTFYFPVGVAYNRLRYEYICIERWIIFGNIMEALSIDRAFFGDSDVVLLHSMTLAFQQRPHCDAVLVVENQHECCHEHHLGIVNGHTSLWQRPVTVDLRRFLIELYKNHTHSVTLMNVPVREKVPESVSRIVITDLQLLWLYWVSRNHNKDDRNSINNSPDVNPQMKWAREVLSFPPDVQQRHNSSSFSFCNGMDAVHNTMFDHMTAYTHYLEQNYTSNLPPLPTPISNDSKGNYLLSLYSPHLSQKCRDSQEDGMALIGELREQSGVPYFMNDNHEKTFMLSIHYQSIDKHFILPDQCRLVLRGASPSWGCNISSSDPQRTGNNAYLPPGTVFDPFVLQKCEELIAASPEMLQRMQLSGFPDLYNHRMDINLVPVLV
jgi:hypothetical protein